MKAALKVLTFKPEATYGVDPVPTTVANVLLAQNVDINPLEMETDAYEPVSHRFGEDEKIVGATWCSVSFDVLLGGGGTPLGGAGTVPNHDPVLRAAAWQRTLSAGVSTVYSPIDSGEESGAMYYHVDGVLQKMLGLRGDCTFSFNSMKAPVLSFKGIGLNVPMIDTVLPTPTLPTVPRPLAVNKANTTISVHGYSANVSELSITQGNDYQYRNLIGREDVVVVGRKSTGKITLELPLVAEKDFWAQPACAPWPRPAR